MNTENNPLIGASQQDTVNNVSAALRAAIELIADRHSGLSWLLAPVASELDGWAGDRCSLERTVEAFAAAVDLMGDRMGGLASLLTPVLEAMEAAATWEVTPAADAAEQAGSGVRLTS